jgi:5-methylcytosine-specific restriction enzyme B
MSKFISIISVRRALLELASWRDAVDSQGAKHLLTFLALKKSGANDTAFSRHTEQNDKRFCDDYLRVRPGSHPYYDPITSDYRISTHYHSNMATARKGTFQSTWKAGSMRGNGDAEEWKLSQGYVNILRGKVLTKAGRTTLIPIFALIAWLYRTVEFPDNITLSGLRDTFQGDFHLSAEEMRMLFRETHLDWSTVSSADYFGRHKIDSDLLLLLLQSPQHFDLAESITELADTKGHSPMKETDIATLITGGRRQIILQGPPGTGKTRAAKRLFGLSLQLAPNEMTDASLNAYCIDPKATDAPSFVKEKGGWMLVQFHPSYSYEDFVQGIAASIDESTKTPVFAVKDGTFLRACALASQTEKLVFFIIDEINRADLSKVLGELIYALEYRGQPITLRVGSGNAQIITIPRNLVVVGTMNSADRSISHIDYAIRRRFTFVTIPPDRSVVEYYLKGKAYAEKVLALYDGTAELLRGTPSYAIGHSFFLAEDASALARNVVFQIMPLLDEYRREGVVDENAVIKLGMNWPGDAIPIHHDRPFELLQQLEDWLGSGA